MKKRSEIVGLVAPVREVAAAGADTHALPIDVEEELVVGGYIDVEMLRSIGELDGFSEVEDRGVFLRRVGSGDPLCGPESGLLGRGKRDDGNDERAESLLGAREIVHLTERGREEDFAAWPGLESPDAHATRSAC